MLKKLSALFIIVVISLLAIYSLQNSFQWINHTHDVIYQLHVLNNDIFDSQTSVREAVFAENNQYFKIYLEKSPHLNSELDNLEWMTRDNPQQQKNIFMLRKNIVRRTDNFRASYDAFNKNKINEAKYYLQIGFGEAGTLTTRNLVEVAEREELRLLDIRLKNYQQRYNFVLISISAFIIFYLIVFNIRNNK